MSQFEGILWLTEANVRCHLVCFFKDNFIDAFQDKTKSTQDDLCTLDKTFLNIHQVPPGASEDVLPEGTKRAKNGRSVKIAR